MSKSTSTAAPTKAPTKLETIQKLLHRKTGATLDELVSATGWQKHSVHGQLAKLRKKGNTIAREARKNGTFTYVLKA